MRASVRGGSMRCGGQNTAMAGHVGESRLAACGKASCCEARTMSWAGKQVLQAPLSRKMCSFGRQLDWNFMRNPKQKHAAKLLQDS